MSDSLPGRRSRMLLRVPPKRSAPAFHPGPAQWSCACTAASSVAAGKSGTGSRPASMHVEKCV
eukprot:1149628-Pelagomonas_calceolata.AAC.1